MLYNGDKRKQIMLKRTKVAIWSTILMVALAVAIAAICIVLL